MCYLFCFVFLTFFFLLFFSVYSMTWQNYINLISKITIFTTVGPMFIYFLGAQKNNKTATVYTI